MFKKVLALFGTMLMLASVSACDSDTQWELNSNSFVKPENAMYIVGSHWNNWADKTIKEAEPSCKFSDVADSETKVYTVNITSEVNSVSWGFKFISSNEYTDNYGAEDVDFEKCNDAFKALFKNEDGTQMTYSDYKSKFTNDKKNRSNIALSEVDGCVGTYKITYDPYNFESITGAKTTYSHKFVIDFTATK